MSDYTVERPSYLFYILSVDKTTLEERSGYLKYTPDNRMETFDIREFSGTMELYNNTFDLFGGAIFEDGEVTQTSLGLGTEICITTVIMIGHPCTYGGEHMPGEACEGENGNGINNAYYTFHSMYTECHTEFDYHLPPGNFTGGGGGVSWTQGFFNGLDQNQKNYINANPTLKDAIMLHLELGGGWDVPEDVVDACSNGQMSLQLAIYLINESDSWAREMIDYLEANNYSPASVSFIYQLTEFTQQNYRQELGENVFNAFTNGDISTLALDFLEYAVEYDLESAELVYQFLVEENYSSDSINYTTDQLNELLNINTSNFPGDDDNLPFEWWKNDSYVEDMFQDPYNVWRSLTAKEKKLIKNFPSEAYIIYKNKAIAETHTNNRYGNTIQNLNGKPDAFRHAYFQAINTVKIKKYWTKLFANAHESEVPQYLSLERYMDLNNNEIGMNFIEFDNPNMIDLTQIDNAISQILNDGGLLYLNPINYNDTNFWDNPNTSIPGDGAHGITNATMLKPTNQ